MSKVPRSTLFSRMCVADGYCSSCGRRRVNQFKSLCDICGIANRDRQRRRRNIPESKWKIK